MPTALILHMNALGEAVFSLPLLHALKHADPCWQTISVAREGNAGLLALSGLADRVIIRNALPGLPGHRQLVRQIRCTRPDACFALATSAGNSLLAWLSGARWRVGYAYAGLRGLLTTVPFEGGGVENYLSLLPVLGLSRTVSSYCGLIQVPAVARDAAIALLQDAGIGPEEPFIAVAPISSGKLGEKAYPLHQWVAVCRLLREAGWPLLLVGAGADLPVHREMLGQVPDGAATVAGRTTPLVLAEVLRRAACTVGVDTGPIHMAAAMGTRCVVLFGPSNPARTAPCGKGHRILYKHLECQPCLDQPCPRDGACLKAITPAEVAAAVDECIRTTKRDVNNLLLSRTEFHCQRK